MVNHPNRAKRTHGQCPDCRHYGKDCTCPLPLNFSSAELFTLTQALTHVATLYGKDAEATMPVSHRLSDQFIRQQSDALALLARIESL